MYNMQIHETINKRCAENAWKRKKESVMSTLNQHFIYKRYFLFSIL